MTARSAEATRKFLTPMSSRRVIAEGASLVWSVENTRWPVRAASVAMPAVSRSRISPIITMFGAWRGAWRRMARSAAANVMPMSVWTATWLMPDIWYSTGSSTVMILRSGLLIWPRQA